MINVGLIGPGNWGKNYITTLENISNVNLVWTATRNYKDKLNLCDAVIIATPYITHYEIIKNVLNARKHVLVEKPITCNSDEVEELVELSNKVRKILMVGHIFLFNPAIQKIKELINTNYLGDIVEIHSKRLSMNDKKDALWEMAPHDIYILWYLLENEPIQSKLYGPTYHRNINLIYPDNIRVTLELCTHYPKKIRQMSFIGTKRIIFFEDNVQKKLKVLEGNKIENIEIEKTNPLENQCRHFLYCIENDKVPISNGVQGFINIKTIENIKY